jgi:hypothetical protein
MKAVLSARSRSYRGAPHPVLYGLLALVAIGAATATVQSGGTLVIAASNGHRIPEGKRVAVTPTLGGTSS